MCRNSWKDKYAPLMWNSSTIRDQINQHTGPSRQQELYISK